MCAAVQKNILGDKDYYNTTMFYPEGLLSVQHNCFQHSPRTEWQFQNIHIYDRF
jgi:hypothetical protein